MRILTHEQKVVILLTLAVAGVKNLPKPSQLTTAGALHLWCGWAKLPRGDFPSLKEDSPPVPLEGVLPKRLRVYNTPVLPRLAKPLI